MVGGEQGARPGAGRAAGGGAGAPAGPPGGPYMPAPAPRPGPPARRGRGRSVKRKHRAHTHPHDLALHRLDLGELVAGLEHALVLLRPHQARQLVVLEQLRGRPGAAGGRETGCGPAPRRRPKGRLCAVRGGRPPLTSTSLSLLASSSAREQATGLFTGLTVLSVQSRNMASQDRLSGATRVTFSFGSEKYLFMPAASMAVFSVVSPALSMQS